MARRPAPGARDRILDAASRLFYNHGVRAVGLQQIIDACGCGKNLLYREFASKDDLIVGYLERCREEWTAAINQGIQPLAGQPAGQLRAVVRVVAGQVAGPGYQGCPFLNTHAEFPDPEHPAHQVSVGFRVELRARLRDLAEHARAGDPGALADRIMLIIDGLYANGAVLGSDGPAAVAVAFADEVIQAATPASATPASASAASPLRAH
jgi:AcrR family transcriptional regulator